MFAKDKHSSLFVLNVKGEKTSTTKTMSLSPLYLLILDWADNISQGQTL
jgi:hypothetical protein